MSKIIKIIFLLVLLLGGFFVLNNSNESTVQVQSEITESTPKNDVETNETSTSSKSTVDIGLDEKILPKVIATTTPPTIKEDLTPYIGEHFIIGFRGQSITSSSDIIQKINKYNVGGVILFDYDSPTKKYGRNISSKTQTKKLVQDLKEYSDHKIFVAIDAEGGAVNRFKSLKADAPQTMKAIDIANSTNNTEVAHSEYKKLAQFLSEIGFNLNFGPVVDVNVNPTNPIIGAYGRSYSSDPKVVVEMAKIFIEEHRHKKILTSLKHFPGHGSSESDSHKGLVDITNAYKSDIEMYPWSKLIQNGFADSIMIAHVFDRNIDSKYPASLSSKHIQENLRKKLNYSGLVISDDMQMGAITEDFGFKEAIIRSSNAGTDIIILSNNIKTYDSNIISKAVDIVQEAIDDGEISKQQIIDSALKIRKVKSGLN